MGWAGTESVDQLLSPVAVTRRGPARVSGSRAGQRELPPATGARRGGLSLAASLQRCLGERRNGVGPRGGEGGGAGLTGVLPELRGQQASRAQRRYPGRFATSQPQMEVCLFEDALYNSIRT